MSTSSKVILYEQPINEHTRACLRLEYLFSQLQHGMETDSVWHSRLTISSLIDALNVLDRPDLKTKLTKELSRHQGSLIRHLQTPQIDQHKLKQVLKDLDYVLSGLNATNGKIGQELRDNEFLSNLRMYLANPGGGCGFDIPAYHLWLQQPSKKRMTDLHGWINQLEHIMTTVQLVLRLIRESTTAENKTALEGFYQTGLNPDVPYQLIRVAVPYDVNAYPEVSVGRHRLCVRFYSPDYQGRATQTTEDIAFKVTCCVM
ncbi:cell division protein ZapD [soil metagenome]